jgi:hypothetical protein
VWVTSGDDGTVGSYLHAKGAFWKTSEYGMHDARALAVDGSTVAVMAGTPGLLMLFDADKKAPYAKFAVDGVEVAQSKSDIQLMGRKAFIAAGLGGVQVVNTDSGNMIGEVPVPEVKGLDPALVTTNGLAADDDLLFICNGGAGIYVAQSETGFDSKDSDEKMPLDVLGQLDLGVSANHVAYRDGYLIIATGTGGLKIVQVAK